MRPLALLLFVALLTGCRAYQPPRFTDARPVTHVADDAPIDIPSENKIIEAVYLSDIYLRRPLVDALETTRLPRARDVNSVDEVPRSSWFWPLAESQEEFIQQYELGEAPEPPLTPVRGLSATRSRGMVVMDARGKLYELHRDPISLPETTTAAAAISSRLLRRIGYRTPEVWVTSVTRQQLAGCAAMPVAVDVKKKKRKLSLEERWEQFLLSGPLPEEDRYRVVATRWPVGTDIGITGPTRARRDDPNDEISHRDRRTLRALLVMASWLDDRTIGPRNTRDAYIGPARRGHVQHFLVGFEESLGVHRLDKQRQKKKLAVGEVKGSFFENLATFGFRRERARNLHQSLASFDVEIEPENFRLELPYEPATRLRRDDGYWAAKQIARIPDGAFGWAVASAKLSDATTQLSVTLTLLERRRRVAEYWYTQATPLEVEKTTARGIRLRDEAVSFRLFSAEQTVYRVEFLDDTGRSIGKKMHVTPRGATFDILISDAACRKSRGYVVVRARSWHDNRRSPGAAEVHVACGPSSRRVIGITH